MANKTTLLIIWLLICAFITAPSFLAYADGDHKERRWYHKIFDHDDDDDDNDKHRKRSHERHGGDSHANKYIKPVSNSTYKEECGACHFPYQPELLPSASWMKLLSNIEDHFGETVELDDNSKRVISDYLKSNGAENSSAKRAVKIMRSLGNQVPLRITDIPYIKEKHHEVSPDILKREAIGSLSNCIACHTTAEKGIYEDDNVKIPK